MENEGPGSEDGGGGSSGTNLRTARSTEATESTGVSNNASNNEPTAGTNAPDQDELSGFPAKIVILPGHSTDMTSVTFQIDHEDHTLGNALRYVILQNSMVEFCGYSLPHPSEAKLNIRIQTSEGSDYKAIDALRQGLRDLVSLCDIVKDNFNEALSSYLKEHPEKVSLTGFSPVIDRPSNQMQTD